MTVSVVIPHFWSARHRNLPQIVRALRESSVKPVEIVIWNNTPDLPEVPADVMVIQSPINVGCKARLLAAMCTTGSHILFQDNDLMVQPETIAHMAHTLHLEDRRRCMVALEGRKLVGGKTYEQCMFLDGQKLTEPMEMEISIGRCELIQRNEVNNALSNFPFNSGGEMDDIWFSYALKLNHVARLCIPYTPKVNGFTNLPEAGVGAHRAPEHMTKRDYLCKHLFKS
jgi:hypothetical protein